jgi:FkbM family methyltransferase
MRKPHVSRAEGGGLERADYGGQVCSFLIGAAITLAILASWMATAGAPSVATPLPAAVAGVYAAAPTATPASVAVMVAAAVAEERSRLEAAAAAAAERARREKDAAVAAEHALMEREVASAVQRASGLLSAAAAAKGGLAGQPPYAISPLLRAVGFKAGFHAAFNPFAAFKDPRYNAVVDGGAFDGSDVLFPAFAAGYDVYSFELSPHREKIIAHLKGNFPEGSFTIVRPLPGAKPAPPPRRPSPHIYFFAAGLSSRNGGVRVKFDDVMTGAAEGMQVEPASDCSDADPSVCAPVVRLEDVVHAEARLWLLKLDVQGHEPQALAGATAILASPARRPHIMTLEWWPAGMVSQGTVDGGVAALTALYDAGARCFDLGTVEGNKIPGLGPERPSEIAAYIAAFLAAPRTTPPGGDPIGAWDDLICTLDM